MAFTIDNSIANLSKRVILPKVIPAAIFIAFLAVFGLIGNAIVIYIFGFSLKKSTIHFFITVLAIFDIVCCTFGFPMEIVELCYSLRYPSSASCHFQRLVVFTCSIGSVIMLLAISIERYRKVCRVALSEISQLSRKIFLVGVVILSFVLASPIVIFSKRRLYNHYLYPNMTSAVCSLPKFSTNPFPLYYLMGIFFLISLALIAMLISYCHVWKTAKRHLMMGHNRRQRIDNCAGAEPTMAQKRLSRTTRTVIATTILFALSFFPSLLLSIFVMVIPPFLNSISAEVAYFTFVRLYILNSSFNCFIYGYFNEQFRYEVKKLLAKILKMKGPKPIDFSSENTH